MTERTSDGLPLFHDGLQIDWRPWTQAPRITHVDQSCDGCGHEGPIRITQGLVDSPTRRYSDRRLIRFWAFRCPGCRETKVCERVEAEFGKSVMTLIEYLRPVIPMVSEPLPHDKT